MTSQQEDARVTLPEDLLDTLFDAVTDFSQWQVFLKKLADLFGGFSASIQSGDFKIYEYSFYCLYNLDHNRFNEYVEYIEHDPCTPLMPKVLDQDAFVDRYLVGPGVMENSRMYKEFLSKTGIGASEINKPPESHYL